MPSAPPTACKTESSCATTVTESAWVSVVPRISAWTSFWMRLMPSVNATPDLLADAGRDADGAASVLSFLAVTDRAPSRSSVEFRIEARGVAIDLVEADRRPDAGAAAHARSRRRTAKMPALSVAAHGDVAGQGGVFAVGHEA